MVMISCVMPVYNAKEDELRRAIDSILNQTFSDLELIIVNDGSTNNSEDVIKSYSDERIVYLKNETNIKISSTLNKGMDVAKGKYIARLDSDDYCDKTRFQKQFNFLEANPLIGLLGTFYTRMPANVQCALPFLPSDMKIMLRYCRSCLVHSSVMYRKSVLDKHNLRYEPGCLHAEDYKLWSEMTMYTEAANLPEFLTYYTISPDGISQSNRKWQDKMVQTVALENIINDFSEDKAYFMQILVKTMKEEVLTKEEYDNLSKFLVKVVNLLQDNVNPPFNASVKNYILSRLLYIKKSD